MLIPVGVYVSVPVNVVVLGEAVDVVPATLVRLEEDCMHLVVRGRALPDGTRLVVTVRDRTRLTGKVVRAEPGHRFVVSRDGAHAVDDRAAPRVTGSVSARWRAGRDDARAWVAGGPDPGPFVEFRGDVDVSVSGMLLEVHPATAPTVGTPLLLELSLGGDGPPTRALGMVRRVVRQDAVVLAAVEFVELPEWTLEALSAFTLARL